MARKVYENSENKKPMAILLDNIKVSSHWDAKALDLRINEVITSKEVYVTDQNSIRTPLIIAVLMASSNGELNAHFFFDNKDVFKQKQLMDYVSAKKALKAHSRTPIKSIRSWFKKLKRIVPNTVLSSIYVIVAWIMIAEPSLFLMKFLHDFDVHYLLKYLLGTMVMDDQDSQSLWWSTPGIIKVGGLAMTPAVTVLSNYALISNSLNDLFGNMSPGNISTKSLNDQYINAVEKDKAISQENGEKFDFTIENPIIYAYFRMKLFYDILPNISEEEETPENQETQTAEEHKIEKDIEKVLERDTFYLTKCSDFFDANGKLRSSMKDVWMAIRKRYNKKEATI